MQQWRTRIPGVSVQMEYFIDSASSPDTTGSKKTVPGKVTVLGEITANQERVNTHITAE